MRDLRFRAAIGCVSVLCGACNSGAPEPVSMNITAANLRLSIVRTATDPFLPRYSLTLTVEGEGGCSSSTDLFPDTGYAGRRNIYLASKGMVYVVGQFDARVIDSRSCRTTLSEFRHLDREVVFIGSFDEDGEHHWRYFSASERPERTLASR
ncbi:MAG TPA: hypothetical protein VLE03_07390 [Nitrospiraceae bacterium]|nr:hypothetical protein [Nitrospiraceae bacterium]